MKKILFFAMMFVFAITSSNAQDVKKVTKVAKAKVKKVAEVKAAYPKVEGPGMVFETETIDYGKIAHNSDGKRQFVLFNNGNQPLIITAATGSCGCTVPSAPKEPIAPGTRAVIDVKYDTSRPGQIAKTVTVTSNAVQGASKTLNIKGEVGQPAAAGQTKS